VCMLCIHAHMHEQGNDETPTFARIFSLGRPTNLLHPRDCDCDFPTVLRWSVALRPTLLVTDTQTRQLSHSHHPDSWSWRYGYQESRGCEWRWRFFATGLLGNWPQYIFLDNEVDITLSCNCYQVPPSFDRAGTHTHSTDRKDRPWILPGPLSIIRSMAGWQLIRQGCWQMGTAGLGWRQRLREKLEMLEIALEFNWRVGRATRLNLPRTLDLDKLTLRTCSALHLF
jgi:hypothetical protein